MPVLVGTVLNLWADRLFKEHGTTVKPFEPSSALVTWGVFRIGRNPMYLGMTLALLGVAVLLGSLTPLAVVVGLAILFDLIFILPGERMLGATFGEEFRAYRERVRRWL